MDCVGICGSDVHYLVHGRIGDFVVNSPMIIGHEASGVVAKVGKNVKNLAVGDRVAIEPGVSCRLCSFCKTGKYNLCPDMKFCATPPYDGNLRRFYAHAADFCFKLPDHVSMEEGALLEPLSVGVHACRRAEVQLGDYVLILGAGPIGLVTLITAKEMGASKVIITDLLESRLKVAKELGADFTLCIGKDDKETDLVAKIRTMMGIEPNKTVDCSGAESTNRLGLCATRSGGIFVIVGCGPPEVKIPLVSALAREVDIRGVFRYANDYSAALALVSSGKANVKRLVTHHYDINETADAFKTSRFGTDGAIKVMIHCQPRDKNNKKPF
jgi:L-iditol 2-dehydrogenase